MPVKVWVFYCPVVITKQFFTTECNICTFHKVNTIALQSAGKLHNGKLPYLINSPGGKVILELVKGFTAFVGILQRISNSIFTLYCPELHRWHAYNELLPLCPKSATRNADCYEGVTSCNTLRICVSNPGSLRCSIIYACSCIRARC